MLVLASHSPSPWFKFVNTRGWPKPAWAGLVKLEIYTIQSETCMGGPDLTRTLLGRARPNAKPNRAHNKFLLIHQKFTSRPENFRYGNIHLQVGACLIYIIYYLRNILYLTINFLYFKYRYIYI